MNFTFTFRSFFQGFPGGTSGKESTCQYRRNETWVRPLGWADPLESGMATYSSILASNISWTEEAGGLQSVGLQSQTQLKSGSFLPRSRPAALICSLRVPLAPSNLQRRREAPLAGSLDTAPSGPLPLIWANMSPAALGDMQE